MRIVVTYDNGAIGAHFGHTEEFKVYNVQGGEVVSSEVVSTNGKGHRELIPVVAALSPDVVICGGVGRPMMQAIQELGCELWYGQTGDADQVVKAYLESALVNDESAVHSCRSK